MSSIDPGQIEQLMWNRSVSEEKRVFLRTETFCKFDTLIGNQDVVSWTSKTFFFELILSQVGDKTEARTKGRLFGMKQSFLQGPDMNQCLM